MSLVILDILNTDVNAYNILNVHKLQKIHFLRNTVPHYTDILKILTRHLYIKKNYNRIYALSKSITPLSKHQNQWIHNANDEGHMSIGTKGGKIRFFAVVGIYTLFIFRETIAIFIFNFSS